MSEDHLEHDLEVMKRLSKQIEIKIQGRVKKIIYQNDMLAKHIPIIESFRSKVKLDIGGEIFCTTIETLLKDKNSLFGSIFGSDGWEEQLDHEDGSYFIDRNPDLFQFVIEFLRTKEIVWLKKLSKDDKAALLEEAEFYRLGSLMNYLTGATGSDTQFAIGRSTGTYPGYRRMTLSDIHETTTELLDFHREYNGWWCLDTFVPGNCIQIENAGLKIGSHYIVNENYSSGTITKDTYAPFKDHTTNNLIHDCINLVFSTESTTSPSSTYPSLFIEE